MRIHKKEKKKQPLEHFEVAIGDIFPVLTTGVSSKNKLKVNNILILCFTFTSCLVLTLDGTKPSSLILCTFS